MAIDQRNQLFRQDADKFWPNLPVSMQAAALAIEISGYARCDVDSARPPKARKSLLRRKFTMVFMAGAENASLSTPASGAKGRRPL